MALPTLTVIIPTLNEESVIALLLEDLVHQSITRFKVILIDAESQDETVKVSSKYTSKLKLRIIQAKKRNVAFQRNHAAKLTDTKLILFLDADSRLHADTIEKLLHLYQKTQADIITSISSFPTLRPKDVLTVSSINLGLILTKLIKQPTCYASFLLTTSQLFDHVNFPTNLGAMEDTQFLRDSLREGYSFLLSYQPLYTMSLRRFHTYGLWSILKKTHYMLGLRSKNQPIPDEIYPMGGGSQYH